MLRRRDVSHRLVPPPTKGRHQARRPVAVREHGSRTAWLNGGPREFRRKSGFEGQEARTGKDFWGQKFEGLGSIETLRTSGAGDL